MRDVSTRMATLWDALAIAVQVPLFWDTMKHPMPAVVAPSRKNMPLVTGRMAKFAWAQMWRTANKNAKRRFRPGFSLNQLLRCSRLAKEVLDAYALELAVRRIYHEVRVNKTRARQLFAVSMPQSPALFTEAFAAAQARPGGLQQSRTLALQAPQPCTVKRRRQPKRRRYSDDSDDYDYEPDYW